MNRIALAVVIVGVLATAAVAATSAAASDGICTAGDDGTVVVELADGTILGADDEVSLYPGTEATAAVCFDGSPEDGDRWTFVDGDGVAIDDEREGGTFVDVTVTRDGETVTPADRIEEFDLAGPTIRIVGADDRIEGSYSGETLVFDPDRRTAYETNVSALESGIDDRAAAVDSLESVTAAVEAGEPIGDDDVETAETSLAEIEERDEAVETVRASLEELLLEAAAEGQSSRAAVAELSAIDEATADADENATAAIEAHESAVADRTEATARDGLTTFGVVAFLGLLVGLPLGAIVPYREAKNVNERLRMTRDVSYTGRVLAIPGVAGALALAIGVGLLVVTGAVAVITVMI